MATAEFIHTRDPATIHFFGTRMRILMSGAQTGGAFCIIEVRSAPGNKTPRHVHRRETETMHVLEGEVTCVVDGKPQTVAAGETALLPPDIPHQLIAGTQGARSILFCTPSGFDDFVRTVGTDAPRIPDQTVMEQVVAVAATFGIEIYPD